MVEVVWRFRGAGNRLTFYREEEEKTYNLFLGTKRRLAQTKRKQIRADKKCK
ncbi:MAG: hypothetical protein L0922_00715 [Candidatus Mariimomonas ferrooxydans]